MFIDNRINYIHIENSLLQLKKYLEAIEIHILYLYI
jgi:hypothetical protein